jgi:hypothetical protein
MALFSYRTPVPEPNAHNEFRNHQKTEAKVSKFPNKSKFTVSNGFF